MNKLWHFNIIVALLCFHFNLVAQTTEIDSLRYASKITKVDSSALAKIARFSTLIADDYPDTTLHYARLGLELSKKNKQTLFEAKFNKLIGIAYDIKGNLDSCLYYLNVGKRIAESIDNQFTIANIYSDIGIAYHFRGNYQLAIRNHLECLKIREKLGDKKNISYALNNLGLVHRARKDYTNALRYYQQSLSIKRDTKDSVGIFNALLNIASCFQYAEKHDSAYLYANQAKQIAIILKKKQAIEEINCQIAVTLLSLDKKEEAKAMFLHYLQLPEALQTKITLTIAYEHLGKVEMLSRNFSKARDYFLKGMKISKDGNKLEALSNFYKQISQCYEGEKNYKIAFEYQQLFQGIKDTLFNIENARQVNEMNAVYEVTEKEKEITQLNAAQKFSQIEIERKKNERNLLFGAALLFLGFAFWTYRSNQIIKQQKAIIQKSLEEKEVLNKEIHHRVKNNLQVISGLLDLQSAHIKDEQAFDAIKESANRVQSMSLIHQQLYQKENITAVNMKTYLLQLVESIKNTYLHKNVTVNCELDECELDVDMAIPLGLITNELLTNCYKYAFSNIENPMILLGFYVNENSLKLIVKDNGVGLAEGFDIKKSKSFGYKIIFAFAKKLKAQVIPINENGLEICLLAQY